MVDWDENEKQNKKSQDNMKKKIKEKKFCENGKILNSNQK